MAQVARIKEETPYEALAAIIREARECQRCGAETDPDFNCPFCGATTLALIPVTEVFG